MSNGRLPVLTGWARIADYLFGRNALIAMASMMLLAISAYATWAGMHDFIVGLSSQSQGRDLPGGLAVSHDFFVIVIVVALTFLMWLALRESFGAGRSIWERMITFPLYAFLALWSIGFGYGFWWSLIAGQEATRTSIAGLQEDARDAGSAITARLDAVRVQLDSVVSWSESQMAREENSGGSCGVASGAGRGPLYNARKTVRDAVASLRDGINTSWLGPVQADLRSMQQLAALGDTPGSVQDRQRRFEARAADIRGKSKSIAARSNELGRSTAAEMRALANSVSTAPGAPGFSCFDPTLSQRLKQAAEQAAQPASLTLREAAFNEGPAGTANAIKSLWGNIGTYMSGLVTYVVSGDTGDKTTSGGEPITGRDLIALLASIGVDLGLFALALLDPPTAPPVRRRQDGLSEAQQNIHQVSPETARQLRLAIDTAISRMPLPPLVDTRDRHLDAAKLEWVHRHFIHHAGYSYLVIPNLFRADQADDNRSEELRALAMNQLAGVFSDLKLVRALSTKELEVLGKEELRDSLTDLNAYREGRRNPAAAPVAKNGPCPGRAATPPVMAQTRPPPAPAFAITACCRKRSGRSTLPAGANTPKAMLNYSD